ncbi:MAG: transporter [Candidatus Margulisiibacteriota bacterium]
MKRIITGFILSAWLMSLPALAYRPFGTEDAGVAGRGVAQLELSWDYLKWRDQKRENVFLMVPIFGLTDRIELSAEIPYLFHNLPEGSDHQGGGDINLVGKYQFKPDLALKGVAKMANGDVSYGLGSGDWDYSLIGVTTRILPAFALNAQLGYTWVGKSQNPNFRDIFIYGLAIDRELNPRFHAVFEINGNRHPDSASTEDPRSLLFGFTYKLSDKLILDAGARLGLTSASPDWSTTVGGSATF